MPLDDYKKQFDAQLEAIRPALMLELNGFLDKMDLDFTNYPNNSIQDMVALYFDYTVEQLTLFCYIVDKNGYTASELRYLMREIYPSKLRNEVRSYASNQGKAELKTLLSFDKFLRTRFEKWFAKCWKEAMKKRRPIPAFISSEGDNYKQDLLTGKDLHYTEIIAMATAKGQ